MATLSIVICGMASAHLRHHSHHGIRRPITVVTTPRPSKVTVVKTNNHLSQDERYIIAIAYLNNNEYLSAKQYAKITGLDKDIAEAELDAFAFDKKKSIAMVMDGKKKLYTLN